MRSLLVLLALLFAASAAADESPDGRAPAGHGGPVRALALSPDGATLVSGGFDEQVILWDLRLRDLRGARPRAAPRRHRGAVSALAALAAPTGGFASAGEDGRIAIWAPRPGPDPLRVLEGHEGPVTALATRSFPGGDLLLSASRDGTARLWNLSAGSVRVLEGHVGGVNAAAFRADGAPVTGGYDGTIRTWGEAGPDLLAELGLPVNALLALPGGALAAGGADGLLRLLAPDGSVREIEVGTRPVVGLAASPDGRTLAVASLGGDVSLVALSADGAEGRVTRRLEGPGLPVWSVALGADGRAWTGGMDHVVRGWDVATGRHLLDLGVAAAVPPAADGRTGDGRKDDGRTGPDPHGARVFRACGACHALTPEAGPMAGPHLSGLFGRRMGTVTGYAYSDRLSRGDITWTRETVADLFTRGPSAVTPGTRMPEQRVDDPEDMAALLRFLEATTRQPSPP